ncbi:hypothetical protein ACIRCZ_18515 [Leifsonia sp. NPDC102414]|uniref:hypothetical protein n=1 Tax=Leifsonia sp. NPDC102414 TaxID=3364124 RepID=UPI0038303EB6
MLRPGETVWLVLDDALQIRFQIEYRLAVRPDTHESLMMYRVDHWVLKREQRWPLGYYDELNQAIDACATALGMPNFITPATAPDGSIVTRPSSAPAGVQGWTRAAGNPRLSRRAADGCRPGGGRRRCCRRALVGPSLAGGWCAVIRMPDFGLEAAAAGIDLDRLILVPHPGERPALSALVETTTVIAAHPRKLPAAGDFARLQGRMRSRDTALVVDREWPGARATLTISGRRVHGVGAGWGHLSGHELDVRGRGGGGTGTLRLVDGQLQAAELAAGVLPIAAAR